MSKKGKSKKERKPWFRLLCCRLGHDYDLPLSYSLRRWLFELVQPRNLTVVQFQYVPGEELYGIIDPDMNRICWSDVKIDKGVFQPLPREALIAITSPKTCSDTSHQSV